jgi:hypothetical protein
LYLSLSNTEPHELPVSALPYDLVREVFRDSPAENRIVILDCCFAGRAIQDMSGTGETILSQLSIVATDIQIAKELIHEPTIELFVGTLIVTLGQRNDCPKFIGLHRHDTYLARNVAHHRNDIRLETIRSITKENERRNKANFGGAVHAIMFNNDRIEFFETR